MELRHIRYFHELAETLNFSRAAEHLHVAQPALSKQIRDLESELGGKLFYRTTTKVQLTELGRYFRQQTIRPVMQLDIAITGAQQIAKGFSGKIKVGCDWPIVGLPLAITARIYREHNPNLSVEFVEAPIREHTAAVRDHSMDVAFVPAFFVNENDNLEMRHVCDVRVKVILPAGHKFAGRKHLALTDLENERWLALDAESIPGYRVIMSEVLQFQPKYGLTTASMPSLVAHVVAGNGIGLLPYWGNKVSEPGIVAVDIDCNPLEIFAIFCRKDPSPLVPLYLDALDEALNSSAS